MAQGKLTDKDIKEIMGEDYFYEYGLDPSLKKFAEIQQHNNYEGSTPRINTLIDHRRTRPWLWRDFHDFLYNQLQTTTVLKGAAV